MSAEVDEWILLGKLRQRDVQRGFAGGVQWNDCDLECRQGEILFGGIL
jgi:hypothetical protein